MSRQSLNWDEMYALLEAFRKEHGHCNVCANWKKNPQLGRWVAMQRYRRKIGELNARCVERLDKLGLVWSPTDVGWNAMFGKLRAYRQKHGHCDVPSQWADDPHLATWVSNQRHRKKTGSLSPGRTKQLGDLGFVWALYGKAKTPPNGDLKTAKAASKAVTREAEQRLYMAGPGTYVQHNGTGPLSARLERYIAQHHGEFPPYIPLPRGPVTFQLGGDATGRKRKVTWSGKGAIPEDVREYVDENGTLPTARLRGMPSRFVTS